jgi:hypothetical protein
MMRELDLKDKLQSSVRIQTFVMVKSPRQDRGL